MRPQIKLGILGDGQLGRMSALAAARLGITVYVFGLDSGSPAAQITPHYLCAPYDDYDALRRFADLVDIITYEFENIPVETVRFLKSLKPVYPDENLLEVTQDRLKEKQFLNDIGIATARWARIDQADQIPPIMKEWIAERAVLKTTRFGYDGKGQKMITVGDDMAAAFTKLSPKPLILEEFVSFSCELSVIVARDADGHMATYGPMLNDHAHHILSKTTVPAPVSETIAEEACATTQKLAEAVKLRGVLTLEMFLTHDNRLVANEIAPRTHNSGHWTIDACACSQFEQHVRTVCGLPVGDPARHSDVEMLNLIGDDIQKVPDYLLRPGTCVHLYGKNEARTGRKMGHVTVLKEKTA